MIYPVFRSLLFRLDPEQAHNLTVRLMHWVGRWPLLSRVLRVWFSPPARPVQALGLNFSNPIGLAAGYDKDGLAWRGLAALGFGHIEVGTVTLRAQPGNPRPRLFRLIPEQAVINRMGFPGLGAEFLLAQLQGKRPPGLVLGVNIGKNKGTPLESAADEYSTLLRMFAPLADYIAVNVSSPNTVGLRRLQARQALTTLLTAIAAARQVSLQELPGRGLPVLVKLAPDLTDLELQDALDVIQENGMDGVIATNTTLSREGLDSPLAGEQGGLSGPPLLPRSLAVVRNIHRMTRGQLPIIGVGGIHDATSAQAMLDAGATLIQLYTGMIYVGPGLVKQILNNLEPID